jgi:hypothetical protein
MEMIVDIVLNSNGTKTRDKDAYRKKFQRSFDAPVRCDGRTKNDILSNSQERKHDNSQRIFATELRHAKRENEQPGLFGVAKSSKFRLVSTGV